MVQSALATMEVRDEHDSTGAGVLEAIQLRTD